MHNLETDRRYFLKLGLGTLMITALPSQAFTQSNNPGYRFIDVTPDFLRLITSTIKPEQFVKAYDKLRELHQTPYSLIDPIPDSAIEHYIFQSRGDQTALIKLSQEFSDYFEMLWKKFDAQLPLNGQNTDIYLLPAPGDSLGGSVRFDGNRDLVILGSEVMTFAATAGTGGSVFIHHELAHLYHQQQNHEIREASRAYFAGNIHNPAALHQIMWLEGFAVYLSKVINPEASIFDLLRSRSIESDISKNWSVINNLVRLHFDATDSKQISEIVFDGNNHIPAKTGYYLGYLMSCQIAKQHDIHSMVKLKGDALRSLLLDALNKISYQLHSN